MSFSMPDIFSSFLSKLRVYSKFIGPGVVVAVGYMDPGNWATDTSAGSSFGYSLLFVILLSNLFAILLQHLSLKLGIASNLDLAQACRAHFPRPLCWMLYITAEIAIMACDLAEVLGTAIAINLLFGLALEWGVLITAADVLLLLMLWAPERRQLFEGFILVLVMIVFICMCILVGKSNPEWGSVGLGFIPSSTVFTQQGLYIAIGILGATVMPHNLYLQSYLVKLHSPVYENERSKQVDEIEDVRDQSTWLQVDPRFNFNLLKRAISYSTIDLVSCLTLAFFVNCSILITAAANFHTRGLQDVADIKDAFNLISQFLGQGTGIVFAIALLACGQSSTITGTLAGQIVMQGFLGSSFNIKPWIRRLVTRVIAIVPAVVVAAVRGEQGVNDLLVLSQGELNVNLSNSVSSTALCYLAACLFHFKGFNYGQEDNGW